MTADDRAVTARGAIARIAARAAERPILATLLALAAVSLLLMAFPGVDLAVTGLFHEAGAGFPATQNPFLVRLRGLGSFAFGLTMTVAVLSLLAPLLLSGARLLLPAREALFLLVAGVIGPGLLVNLLFKGYWGRARPVEVTEFGGSLPFTGPWWIVDHCDWNCSFMSGEASSSIFLLGLAMIAPRSWRRAIVTAVLVFASVMSLNRIAFGGHFFSDVVISWLVTLLVLLLVHRAILGPQARLTEAALSGGLGRFGDGLRRLLSKAGASVRRFLADFR